jgi:hypothetical protein
MPLLSEVQFNQQISTLLRNYVTQIQNHLSKKLQVTNLTVL